MAATHLIAVGTQSAHIFVFDSNQVGFSAVMQISGVYIVQNGLWGLKMV